MHAGKERCHPLASDFATSTHPGNRSSRPTRGRSALGAKTGLPSRDVHSHPRAGHDPRAPHGPHLHVHGVSVALTATAPGRCVFQQSTALYIRAITSGREMRQGLQTRGDHKAPARAHQASQKEMSQDRNTPAGVACKQRLGPAETRGRISPAMQKSRSS